MKRSLMVLITRWSGKNRYTITLILLIVLLQIYFYLHLHSRDGKEDISFSHFSSAVEFLRLPETKDGRYKVWSNIWRPLNSDKSSIDVGVATQCSVDNLSDLLLLKKHWDGMISISVFIRTGEWSVFKEALQYLIYCDQEIGKRVNFHAIFPLSHPPSERWLDIKQGKDKGICSPSFIKSHYGRKNYNYKHISYPVNALRNVAIKNLHTSHVLLLDIDMVPSRHLRRYMLRSRLLLSEWSALVIPAFEMKSLSNLPHNKSELIKLWDIGDIRPFYQAVCWKCQKYTNYEVWRNLHPNDLKSYTVGWHDPWEPFYTTFKKHVMYDERFEQYGFNRISQLCHMHMSGFQFHVLDNVFIIHIGFKEKKSFHKNKDAENKKNKVIYQKVKSEMLSKYPYSKRHC